jgi:phage baseplate assembly protein W
MVGDSSHCLCSLKWDELFDTIDGSSFMNFAYGCGLPKLVRKVYFHKYCHHGTLCN